MAENQNDPSLGKKLENVGNDVLDKVTKEALSEWKPKSFWGKVAKFIASAITPKDVFNIVVKKENN